MALKKRMMHRSEEWWTRTSQPTKASYRCQRWKTCSKRLGSGKSINDFFGKEGIFARLFAKTLEHRLEAELTSGLGYEKDEAKGHNSGNSRNGHYRRSVKTSGGEGRDHGLGSLAHPIALIVVLKQILPTKIASIGLSRGDFCGQGG
jgi:hypothetical protein